MLKEIAISEIADYEPECVLVIHEDTVCRLDEFQEGFRFLIDEIPAEDDPEDEEDDPEDEEEPEEPEEEPEPKRRTRAQIIELITEALSDGKRTVAEIANATGLDYKTTKKYLATMEEME